MSFRISGKTNIKIMTLIIIDKMCCSITKPLPMLMLTNINSEIARKAKNYKSKWDTPLLSEDNRTVDKVVDKTGKPKEVDDKMVKAFQTTTN